MAKINIVYLPYRRWHFSDLIFSILSKCQFKDFHITINGNSSHIQNCQELYEAATHKYGLDASVYITNETWGNYMDKVRYASNLDYEYSLKLDEDIFMGPQVFDYIFDNLNLLNDEENLILSPALSSGIPTVDRFIQYNLTPEQQAEMSQLFAATRFGHAWGVDYSSLNQSLANGYDEDIFYNAVSHFNHSYRGIHPIRTNFEAQRTLNQFIVDNVQKISEPREYKIERLERPYFCNSVFAIKTKTWNNIANDKSLAFDAFDEVSLNRYRERHNKKFLYIINAFAIHTLYNTLWEYNNQEEVNRTEEELYQHLLTFIKSS